MSATWSVDLEQGWAKGLRVCFLDAVDSSRLDLSRFCRVHQVHGNELVSVENATESCQADGVWSQGPLNHKPLLVSSADCCPLIYIDHDSEKIAAVHAGWRGVLKKIHLEPFDRVGMNPKTTWVWLGPSLSGMDFEVQEDMWSQFPEHIRENPKVFLPSAQNAQTRYYNVWEHLRLDFEGRGVELFYNVGVSTFCDSQFNSYRRWKKSGQRSPVPLNRSWVGRVQR